MVEEIIRYLRGVNGNTLGEIFKSLNLIFRNNDNDIRPNVEAVLLHFHPENDLEKFFRLKLIDRYKCCEEVLGILKSEDYFYISHVLKFSWFFSNTDFNPELLVDTVFPLMSYSTRLKVLRRYSKFLKNTMISETFFNHLKERYGICTAFLILPACSEDFVSRVLTSVCIQMPYSVVNQLLNIYPSVIINYLKYLLECSMSQKRIFRQFNLNLYQNIFHKVASVNPSEFYRMVEKYHSVLPYLKLGKRLTRRLIRSDYQSLKQNISILKKFLDWKSVGMKLSIDQIEEIQLTQAPSSVSEFFLSDIKNSDFVSITIGLKPHIRQELLLKNFEKAYNKDIKDYIDVMDGNILDVLPVDLREAWVDLKLTKVDNIIKKADCLVYLPTKKSFPALMKIIENQSGISDVQTRLHIVNCLFQTIKVNNDWHLLGQLCEYIVKKFRNDQRIIRDRVIEDLSKCHHLIQISDADWVPIEELINISVLNDEANQCPEFILKILSIQVLSRFQRNLPVEPYIEKLFKLSDEYYEFKLCEWTPYEKQCLLWFVENFNKKRNESNKKGDYTLVVKLFKRLCMWNGKHPGDQITVPGWILERLEQIFREEYDYRKKMILDAVKVDPQLKYVFYNKIFPEYCDPQVLLYKLRADPKSMASSSVTIMKNIFEDHMTSYTSFFKQTKFFSNINLPQELCKVCLDVLHEKETSEEFRDKSKSIAILSILLPTSRFVEIISEFYPKEKTIGDYSEKGREIYKIQREIAASLKVVNSPSEVLESLRKFAVGDFLKLFVGSISSVCVRIPEYKILSLLRQWLDCPVSLRKHLMRAFFRIAPIASTREMIVGIFEVERNSSLRYFLFDHSRKIFIREPCPETYAFFKDIIRKLTMADGTALDGLCLIDRVPDDFISEYLQLVWVTIKKTEEATAKRYKIEFINNIERSIIQLLREEFCDELLEQVFEEDDLIMNLKTLVVQYLVSSQELEQLTSRIEKVMLRIQGLVSKWNDFNLKAVCVFPSRNTISHLVEALVRESFQFKINTAVPPIHLLTKFRAALLGLLKEDDVFEEILSLEISMFFHTSYDDSEIMYHFSNFIEPIVERHTSVYGTIVINIICQSIINIFKWKFIDPDNVNHVLYQQYLVSLSEILITTCSSTNCQILGLELLPNVITSDISRYKKILNLIFLLEDRTVRMLANKLYKELSSSVTVE